MFKIQRQMFHKSYQLKIPQLLPVLTVLTKYKISKFGFMGFRWIWFMLPVKTKERLSKIAKLRFIKYQTRWNFFALLSVCNAYGFYTYFTNIEEVPISHRRRFKYLKSVNIKDECDNETNGMLNEFDGLIYPKTSETYVNIEKIVKKLQYTAQYIGVLDRDIDLNVYVIKNDTKNAVVLPNGNVFIFDGMIELCEYDYDRLGIILGHELAHVIAEHSAESVCRSSLFLLLDAIFWVGLSVIFPSDYMFGITEWFRFQGLDHFIDLPYSRMNETEADYIGAIIADRCGFDINKSVQLWNDMEQQSGDSIPEIFSTHPNSINRAIQMDKWISVVKRLNKRYHIL